MDAPGPKKTANDRQPFMHVLIQRTMSVNRHMVRALGWAFSYFFALLCSYYIITHPHVTCVIPATSKVKQITDNMAAGVGRLPGADLRRRMVAHVTSL